MATPGSSAEGGGEGVSVTVRWGKQNFTLNFAAEKVEEFSLHDFKRELEKRTSVLPKRQKLVGIGGKGVKANGLSEEQEKTVTLRDLLVGMKPGKSVMMIGTAEAVIESHRKEEELKLGLSDNVSKRRPVSRSFLLPVTASLTLDTSFLLALF